ncbi:hypothetical protein ACRPK1_07720 [Lactobacillus johnsonii]|uniref:hypothetical protein n=1 Tax=Lactobacillus johnsonii TaxID=33959 RepID=UPI003D783B09
MKIKAIIETNNVNYAVLHNSTLVCRLAAAGHLITLDTPYSIFNNWYDIGLLINRNIVNKTLGTEKFKIEHKVIAFNTAQIITIRPTKIELKESK